MTDLSPKARALIEQSRDALRPRIGDRDRIESALRERLGSEAMAPDTGASQFIGFASTRALFRVAIGVCAVAGGVAFWAVRPNESIPESRPAAPAPPTAAALTEAPPAPAPEPAPVEVVAPSQPHAAAPSSPRKRDPLAQEVALLTRATEELHRGHAGKALTALDEHQRRFPQGSLSEERRAAKAQALCLIGRVREGRVEQASLEPRSPAAARASEVCDAAAAGPSRR